MCPSSKENLASYSQSRLHWFKFYSHFSANSKLEKVNWRFSVCKPTSCTRKYRRVHVCRIFLELWRSPCHRHRTWRLHVRLYRCPEIRLHRLPNQWLLHRCCSVHDEWVEVKTTCRNSFSSGRWTIYDITARRSWYCCLMKILHIYER